MASRYPVSHKRCSGANAPPPEPGPAAAQPKLKVRMKLHITGGIAAAIAHLVSFTRSRSLANTLRKTAGAPVRQNQHFDLLKFRPDHSGHRHFRLAAPITRACGGLPSPSHRSATTPTKRCSHHAPAWRTNQKDRLAAVSPNSIRRNAQAAAKAVPFRLLRQPSQPKPLRPEMNRAKAAGRGVCVTYRSPFHDRPLLPSNKV